MGSEPQPRPDRVAGPFGLMAETYHPNANAKEIINGIADRNGLDPAIVHGMLEAGFTYDENASGVVFMRINGITQRSF